MELEEYDPRRYRQMRDDIVEDYCNRIETHRDMLMACSEQTLAERVHQIYVAGGAPLSGYTDMADLVRWAIVGAQAFLQHAVQQRLIFLGNFEEQKKRTVAVAELEYEAWVTRFRAWCRESS